MKAILEDGAIAVVPETPADVAAIEALGLLTGGDYLLLVRCDEPGTATLSHLQASGALPMMPGGCSVPERVAIAAGKGEPAFRRERAGEHVKLKDEIAKAKPPRPGLRLGVESTS